MSASSSNKQCNIRFFRGALSGNDNSNSHKLSVNITCYTLKLYNRDVPGKSVHNVRSVMSVVG